MTKLSTRGHEVADAIQCRNPFTTHGALKGEFWSGYVSNTLGHLPTAELDILRKDVDKFGNQVYVVWSYNTPIYWSCPDGTHYRPEVKYSVTTSKHQGKCPRNQECGGRGGTHDDRCGRYFGHYGPCDWCD